ncbi:MAG: universal stress protein [Candidatus Thermoplasmatota archaeon]
MQGINRVVIPVDRSDISRIAVEHGAHLAELLGVEVSIISIDDTHQFMASPLLEQKIRGQHEAILQGYKKMIEGKVIKVQTEIIVGSTPADEIVKYAQEGDLLVMATRSKKGLNRCVLGSVSDEVLKRVDCPVMILKSKNPEEYFV